MRGTVSNYDEFYQHCVTTYPEEACGLVIAGAFVPCENISDSPCDSFEIDPRVISEHFDQVQCVVHSHTGPVSPESSYDLRAPSKEDMEGQAATGLPWAIVHCDGESVSEAIHFGDPENRPPLHEREFVFNAQDCFTLLADCYYQTHQIVLPELPRDWDWFKRGEDLIGANYEAFGFYEVSLSDARPSDVVLFTIKSSVINHIGIYLGGNEVLHHYVGHLSGVDELSKWAKYITKIVRHKALK